MDNTFITTDDYTSVCTERELSYLNDNTQQRQQTERVAMETVAGYLRSRYDITAAYTRRDDDRNPQLVQAVINVTLWLMTHRLPANMGHERRECLYNDTIAWLKDVQAGKASPDLPTYTDPGTGATDANNPMRYGSMPPSRYDY